MALKQIDQDTIQPGGKRGLPGRTAFTIVNENAAETEQRLSALEGGSGGVSAAIDALEAGQASLQEGQLLLRGTLESARTELQGSIESEADARADSDAGLGARIDAEQIARQQAVDGLAAMVGLIPGKNVLINGAMGIWQRGVSFAAAASARYTVDRWQAWGAGSTIAVARQAMDGVVLPPQPRRPGKPAHAAAVTVVSVPGANNFALFQQQVEDARTLSNGKATFSGWVYCGQASVVGFSVSQVFGTGGSAAVAMPAQVRNLAANSWNFVTVTFDVPSVEGKAIGPNSSLCMNIWMDAGSSSGASAVGQRSGTYWFTGMQLEAGGLATGFEVRHPAAEFALCQRYFATSYPPGTGLGVGAAPGRLAFAIQSAGVSPFLGYALRFPVQMRAAPAVTVYAAANGAAGQVSQSADGSAPATVRLIAPAGCEVNWGNDSGQFGGWFHYSADAEL